MYDMTSAAMRKHFNERMLMKKILLTIVGVAVLALPEMSVAAIKRGPI